MRGASRAERNIPQHSLKPDKTPESSSFNKEDKQRIRKDWRKSKVISFQTVEALLVERSFSGTVN